MPDPSRQIADCRRDLHAMAQLWRGVSDRSAKGARTAAEVQVFNQMVVALASRLASPPQGPQILREVQLLAAGVQAGGRFPSAPGWRADMSVTGYAPGDRIALDEAVFSRLCDAYLTQMARLIPA